MKNPYSKLNTLKEINPTGLGEAREREIPEYLKKNPGHKVLNVGSGNTTLVDNRIVHMDIFRYKVIDVVADASHLPFPDRSFDAIFCDAVIRTCEKSISGC